MPKRPTCQQCERPLKTCLCDVMVQLNCEYHLVILQDPKEAKHALSSAPLLAKSIKQSTLVIGEVFDPLVLLGEGWQNNSLLIFPNDNSLSQQQVHEHKIKYLILLDGTWRKVARMMHLNPWLSTLPCFAIDSANASQYLIRKSPRVDGLSTIEAAVMVLNNLQPEKEFSPILAAFHKMIDFQIQAMGSTTFERNYPKD